ncbi:MAG: hypothetical protein K2K87_00455, partial [Lachnospiraceae bacterium]|nr:hypothetical protein [Lachnospiraceae bacterium]
MTRSLYSSLIKSNLTVVQDEEKIVIDTNALIAQKLEALSGDTLYTAADSDAYTGQGVSETEDDG